MENNNDVSTAASGIAAVLASKKHGDSCSYSQDTEEAYREESRFSSHRRSYLRKDVNRSELYSRFPDPKPLEQIFAFNCGDHPPYYRRSETTNEYEP